MTPLCLNHRQMNYDMCKNCSGKDMDCPEYLETYVHARHKAVSSTLETSPHAENYSKPVEFRRLTILEAQATTRHFLKRFYGSMR